MEKAKLNKCIREYYELKCEKEKIDARIKILTAYIISQATFKDTTRTSILTSDLPFTTKIVAKDRLKWEQQKLENFKNEVGLQEFTRLFKREYKHNSKQVIDNFIDFSDKFYVKILLDALTVHTSYSISIEEKEE